MLPHTITLFGNFSTCSSRRITQFEMTSCSLLWLGTSLLPPALNLATRYLTVLEALPVGSNISLVCRLILWHFITHTMSSCFILGPGIICLGGGVTRGHTTRKTRPKQATAKISHYDLDTTGKKNWGRIIIHLHTGDGCVSSQ